MTFTVWQIFGVLVFIFGVLDAGKYSILTAKIKKYKSSRGQSRIFTNLAIAHKILLSIWSVFYLKDWVVALASLLALYTSIELYYWIWVFYPFKNRTRFGWKRPSFLTYFINSWLPNKIARRL